MVTNQLFVKEQIPVELEGKTYYGCCEMCKAKIKNNPQSREATDPVSGKKVDKAEAVIGASADGNIYYFESEENLAEFNPSAVN
jgi:YHS domain-containing protein